MRWKRMQYVSLILGIMLLQRGPAPAQQPLGKLLPPVQKQDILPMPRSAPPLAMTEEREADPGRPIDLPTALRLAGVANPQIQLARERVLEAVALRQLAAAQILPNINYGLDLNHHQGPLQQSSGNIIQVNRDSMYIGLGAAAVGAGTVTIPGIYWSANVSDVYFSMLVRQQLVQQRRFDSEAIRNDVLLRVAVSYLELLRGQGRRALAVQIRNQAAEVARVTENFAKSGQGRQADADRAATEREQRQSDLVQAESEVQIASARLCELLSLDPATRLVPAESQIIPSSLVPELIPLGELLVIALTQRPELKERQAAVRGALLELQHAKALPFSPQIALGYSAGSFGGGSNLTADRFGNFGAREDFDAVMYWSLRNLGVGNLALIRLAQSQTRQTRLTEIVVLDRIRAEVATALARVQARLAQIETNEKAVQSSKTAFDQDLLRTRNNEGLPIEVLDSLRLLARSRFAYLDAIIDYNRAHFELYVALGQPPADVLARPVPAKAVLPLSSKK